jgi:polyhydroxybutyrate depolymerase
MTEVKKLFIALSAVLVWTGIPAVSANAVSVGQSCTKTTLGTRVSTRINKKPVIVVCRVRAGRKQWIRAAVQTITTTTTSTSTTSTTVPEPVVNYTVVVDPNDPSLHTITIEGMQPRTYSLNVPTKYSAATATPLLLALHSRTSSFKTIFEDSKILSWAESMNFIVAGLNGSIHDGISSWNAGTCCTNATTYEENDLLFASTVIDFVSSKYTVDKSRIWAMGHSNGGMMSYRLACDLSDKITAIAVVTGAQTDPTCSPTKPVSIIQIHGNLDTTVPFHGGGKLETPSIFHSVQDMAYRNLCSGKPKESSDAIEERYIWVCTSGVETQLVNYQENSHAWEAGYTEEILQFLFAHPRR